MIKKIGYDIDGCVCESYPWFTGPLMEKYPEMFPNPRAYDKHGHELYHFKMQVGTVLGEFGDLIADNIAKYHHLMHPVQGAVWHIEKIYHITGQVPVFITCRSESSRQPFIEWMKMHMPGIPYHLQILGINDDKIDSMHKWGLTHYVEDRFKNANQLAPLLYRVYLLDKIYNNRTPVPGVLRVYDWSTIAFDYLEGR